MEVLLELGIYFIGFIVFFGIVLFFLCIKTSKLSFSTPAPITASDWESVWKKEGRWVKYKEADMKEIDKEWYCNYEILYSPSLADYKLTATGTDCRSHRVYWESLDKLKEFEDFGHTLAQ